MAEPTVNWITGVIDVPKSYLNLVQATPTEIYNLDLNAFRLSLRDLEDDPDGRPWTKTHSHNTEVTLAGLTYARVIEILDPYTVTFEDGQYAVNLIGANSNVADKSNVNQVSIRPQNSAGLITTQAIEFGEYGEAVTLDVINGFAGQVYPTGTRRRPSNNVPDLNNIATFYGFNDIKVLENTTFGTTNAVPDNIQGYHVIGVSHVTTEIVIEPEALCLKTGFSECAITGTLDGDSEIRNCVVGDLVYFNGHIHDSYLNGTITLSGSLNANIEDCSILDFDNPPIIDAGGSGQDLMMPNYSGILIIKNLTGNSKIGIGLDAGQVIIDSSCIAGTIQISGNGSVVDNSGIGCYVIDSIINGTDVQNLSRLIELQRPHHTGTGNIWFWNPFNGDDNWDGKHAHRATKTFAHAHSLADDNHHDIIVCVAGNTAGVTVTNETLVITKNYLFVRGPGRDFSIVGTNDAVATIDIQSNGVEISGLIASSNPTNNVATIKCTGTFPLIKDTWIENGSNGILLDGASNGSVEGTRIRHNTGYGIHVQGDTAHLNILDTHVANNSSNGVEIDLSATYHELFISQDSIIHNNGAYGVTISATTDGVIFDKSINIFDNALGSVQDLGTDTWYATRTSYEHIADYVWNKELSTYPEDSAGGLVQHLRHLYYTVFLDTSLGIDGDGSQHEPFNSEASAVDFAEDHGLLSLTLQADVDFTRQIKNFLVTSTNIIAVDFGGNNMNGSRFDHLTLKGTYTGSITAQDCNIQGNTTLNGFFDNCAIGGSFEVPNNGIALLQRVSVLVKSLTPPVINIGGVAGTAQLNAMGLIGGVTITNCNQATDIVKVVLHGGLIIIDASCTDGQIRLFGSGLVINNGSVADYENYVIDPRKVNNINSVNMNRRITNESNKTITTYEDDQSTVHEVFDYTENGNGAIVTITPQ